jgi:hypothetical protein
MSIVPGGATNPVQGRATADQTCGIGRAKRLQRTLTGRVRGIKSFSRVIGQNARFEAIPRVNMRELRRPGRNSHRQAGSKLHANQ